jgi:hypothetical protein
LKKIQSFFILKFSSDRLKESNYKIDINLQQAKLNFECVRLSDSELLRFLRRIRNIEFSAEKLEQLEKELWKTKKSNILNKKEKIQEIKQKIEDMLYVPCLISINFVNVSHYKTIIQKGLYINGNKFVRLLSSAGMQRRSTVLFIDELYFEQTKKFIDCGRDLTIELNPQKYNAYTGLASSATLSVRTPRFIVVPNYEVIVKEMVDFVHAPVTEGIDSVVEQKEIETIRNIFDGQGLISPQMMSYWADDLEIEYLPSSCIIRSTFIKGLLITFDYHTFAKEHNISKVVDIYGEWHNIEDVDVLLSLSMFKMASAYKNLEEFKIQMIKYNWGWGITRVAPHKDLNTSRLAYQYIHGIPLSNEEIESLSYKTRENFENVITNKNNVSTIFNLGEIDVLKKKWFDALEPIIQAVLLNKDVAKDSFFKKKMINQINKKMKDTFLGKFYVNGNYQFLAMDMVAQAEHIFGLPVKGILKKDEFFSNYWNQKNVNKIAGFRSPLTWRIEKCTFDLVKTKETNRWFFYSKTNLILNIYNDTMARLGGGDADGDSLLTTSQQELLDNSLMGNLVKYEIKKAPKQIIDDKKLWEYDARGFSNKIGAITNASSSMYCLLENFDKNSKEYEKIINRIKICNSQQGMQIDKNKGIDVHPYPDHFSKITKSNDKHTSEQIKEIEFNNTIIVNKRPYFFKYLYPDYAKRYKKEIQRFNTISLRDYGRTIESLLSSDIDSLSIDEKRLLDIFKEKSSFMFYPSTMNRIVFFMEKEINKIKKLSSNKSVGKFDYSCLLSKDFVPPTEDEITKIKSIFYLYRDLKKQLRYQEENENNFENTAQISNYINNEAYNQTGYSSKKLADLSVYLCYEIFNNGFKSFVWNIFGEEVVENMLEKSNKIIEVPIKDENGEIEYLFDRYSMQKIEIL